MACTVFLVDDDPDFRLATSSSLRRRGIDVIGEAADGREFLAAWSSLPSPPDVVVLDEQMPHLRGTEVAAKLLEQHPGQDIILITGSLVDRRLRHRAADLGIRSVMTKDNISLLADTLSRLYEGHARLTSPVEQHGQPD